MSNNEQLFGNPNEGSLGGFMQNAVNKMANKQAEMHNAQATDVIDKVIPVNQGLQDNEQGPQTSAEGNKAYKHHPNPMLEIFYEKLEKLGVNLAELKPILEDNSKFGLVASIAGSGKTTGIVLKVIRDLVEGSAMTTKTVDTTHGERTVVVPCKILISTFLKTGAADIEEKFREWIFKLGLRGIDMNSIKFSTIHSETYQALKEMGQKMEMLDNAYPLIRSVATQLGIEKQEGNGYLGVDELRDIESIIGYARNRLDSERYNQLLATEYAIDAVRLDMLVQGYQRERRFARKFDFEDLQEMLLDGAKVNPKVAEFLGNRYDYVIVDEFQDTSQLQYELLKHYFANSRHVYVYGDADQTIYSFRGSDANIIVHKFIEDFNPTVYKLTTNYRCKSNILNSIAPSIKQNINRIDNDLNAFKEGGTVNVLVDSDINHLVTSIRQDIASGMSVGVMARINADLLVPAMLLEIDNTVQFQVSKSVTMNARLPQQVYGMIDLVTKRYTDDFKNLLRCFVPRYKWYEADTLTQVLKSNSEATLYNLPMDEIAQSCPTISKVLENLRRHAEVGGKEAYLYLLSHLEHEVYAVDSNYTRKGRELVRFTRKLILEHDKVKDLNIHGIDNLFNSVLPHRIANRIKYSQDTQVKLTTVHEAKGKEWDSCYIWNDAEGMFPYQLGSRDLTSDEIEEERRIHYIAFTRAKEKLTVYTYHNRESMFLKEIDKQYIQQNPVITDKDRRLRDELNGVDGNGVPTTVFRAKPTADDESVIYRLKTMFDNYFEDVQSGVVGDPNELSFVLDKVNYDKDLLVNEMLELYGLNISQELDKNNLYSYFEDYFSKKAVEILNKGSW